MFVRGIWDAVVGPLKSAHTPLSSSFAGKRWRLPSVLLLLAWQRASLWEMSLCMRRPREHLSTCCGLPALRGEHCPPKKKLLQNLRSPFQHSLFPAASISQAKMGWGGRVRYCKLFPPAMTVYIWLLSKSRGYSETRVWFEGGAELPTSLGCRQIDVQHLEQLAGLCLSAEHPRFS